MRLDELVDGVHVGPERQLGAVRRGHCLQAGTNGGMMGMYCRDSLHPRAYRRIQNTQKCLKMALCSVCMAHFARQTRASKVCQKRPGVANASQL